jgi:hypothetical protein
VWLIGQPNSEKASINISVVPFGQEYEACCEKTPGASHSNCVGIPQRALAFCPLEAEADRWFQPFAASLNFLRRREPCLGGRVK